MIRILHVLPGNMNMGGIETYLMNLYRHIDRTKIQFDFVVHSKEKNYFEEEILSLGGQVYHLFPKMKHLFKYKKEFMRILKEHDYSTVHIHAVYAISYFEAKYAKEAKVNRVIVHSHNTSANWKRRILHSILKKRQAKYVDVSIACSNDAAKWMFHPNVYQTKNFLIWNNAIETSLFQYNEGTRTKLRKQYQVEDRLVIGAVGRLSEQKNPERLMDIFYEIWKEKPEALLFLIGRGELKEVLMKKIEEYKLTNHVILLEVTNQVYEYMQIFDLFVLPTRYEGLGIVFIEAQVAGLKCFTTKDVVPLETKITENIHYIPMTDSDVEWKNQILKEIPYERTGHQKEAILHGYDLVDLAHQAEEFYLK